MTVHGMNRWKSAKASEFTTAEGSGQADNKSEDGNGGIKKPPFASKRAAAGTTASAMAKSPLMRPSGEGSEGPIKKNLRVRGSQKMQAVRPDENPGPDQSDQNERAASEPSRPPRRRRRRTTRASARSTP